MKIVCVAGARPNFMKIAPLMHAMAKTPSIEAVLVHTGQHYDKTMSDVFFEQLGIPEPDANLGVGGGTREEQIERIIEKFEPYLQQVKPDAVLVVGDVNSTVACTRVARKLGVPTIHVEAGLRSFDPDMPEEINRIETDQLSDYLFVTEQSGMENLQRESITGQAFLVGNVMIDTLAKQMANADPAAVLRSFGLQPGEYLVGTFHRPSNVDTREGLQKVVQIMEYIAGRTQLLLPLHPRTRNALDSFGWLQGLHQQPNLILSEPIGYLDFIALVSQAKGIVTDSGGIQEETTYLGVPCITMRENTERPATVDIGTNILAHTSVAEVSQCIDALLLGQHKKGGIPPLWDGQAATRIVDIIAKEIS